MDDLSLEDLQAALQTVQNEKSAVSTCMVAVSTRVAGYVAGARQASAVTADQAVGQERC